MRRGGKTTALATMAASHVMEEPDGCTAFVLACGCTVKLAHAEAHRALSEVGSLVKIITDMLNKHVCPTRSTRLLT